jgi:hypothetical protein
MTSRRARVARLAGRVEVVVWKDPFAATWARRLATVHGVPVVATVRPPLAVAASFKRLGWGFDVADLVRRLGDDGARFSPLLTADGPPLADPVHNAAVLWTVLNTLLAELAGEVPHVHLVALESVVSDPLAAYERLFAATGLALTPAIRRRLTPTASPGGPDVPAGDRAHVRDRDVRAVNRYWSSVLTPEEVTLVERVTGPAVDTVRGSCHAS